MSFIDLIRSLFDLPEFELRWYRMCLVSEKCWRGKEIKLLDHSLFTSWSLSCLIQLLGDLHYSNVFFNLFVWIWIFVA